jgi:hypothetical protein
LPAQLGAVTKLLLILALGGVVASGLAAKSQPPLLIDNTQSAPLDASR